MNLLVFSIARIFLITAGAITGDEGIENDENIKLVGGAIVFLIGVVWAVWERIRLMRAGIRQVSDAERRIEPRGDPADNIVQEQLRREAISTRKGGPDDVR